MQSSPLAFLSHSTVISLHMNVPDCNYRRNNNAQRQASGGPESSLDLSPFPPSDMPTLWRRRKSRSPDSKTSQRSIPSQKSDASNIIKRKKSGTSMAHAPEADVTIVDRGRRIKSKSTITLTSRLNVSTENTATTSGSVNRSSHPVANKKEKEKVRAKEKEKEKEHSKSRDTHVPSRNHVPSQPAVSDKKADSQDGFQPECSGPLAMAEFKRMQKEIDSLKKIVHENKKVMKRQIKTIEDLKEDLDTRIKVLKEKDAQLQKLKSKSKKTDELVSSFETNMQCQICLDLLLKPFALPPCGHILCLACLQEWFRKAPVDDDDMYDDDNENYLLYRQKTCPCCRAVVSSRPIPIFIVKTIATALAKTKNLTLNRSRSNRTSPAPDDDPWAGLFPPAEDETFDDDEDQDDDEDEDDGDVEWGMNVFAYGSASDEEPYEGEYVPAQWEPPSVNTHLEDFPYDEAFQSDDLCMFRRGVTMEMIANYQIEYTHGEGLSVLIEDIGGPSRVYLGWNIKLSADDPSGEEYLDWVIGDIATRPERWEVTNIESGGGAWEARKLVPFEDAVDYDTTDSENWIDNDDLD